MAPPRAPLRTSPPGVPAARPARAGAPSWREEARRRSFFGWNLPLTGLHLSRIELLERLVGKDAYLGWGQEPEGPYFVDVRAAAGDGVERYRGETLHKAIGAAIRATQGVFR